eukprot:TRINITY_DN912_c0_g1_i7.p1 TRINITY_DN912_c0_g1~~TRINITY_DN912_c0_g1_i7.p1  ORF type:complete len:266 (-),score=58.51 TRINITY_DN912_c0_g1_i7:66-863(-)
MCIRDSIYTDDKRGMDEALSVREEQNQILFSKYFIVFSDVVDDTKKNLQVENLRVSQDLKIMKFLASGENLEPLSVYKTTFQEKFTNASQVQQLQKLQLNLVNETTFNLQLHTYDQDLLEQFKNSANIKSILTRMCGKDCSISIKAMEKYQVTRRNLQNQEVEEPKSQNNQELSANSNQKFIKISSYLLNLYNLQQSKERPIEINHNEAKNNDEDDEFAKYMELLNNSEFKENVTAIRSCPKKLFLIAKILNLSCLIWLMLFLYN